MTLPQQRPAASTGADGADDGGAQRRLVERIRNRTARIGIVGLGYVGLPTAVAYADVGFTVVGIDTDAARCASVGRGDSYIEDVASAELRRVRKKDRLTAVASVTAAGDLDVIDICVHTPLGETREPDISAIRSAAEALVPSQRPGQLVVLTSTSYPGTTEEVLRPILERSGMVVGADVFIAFAPERIDPGNKRFTLRTTPKVVGGVDEASTRVACLALSTIVDTVVPVRDATTAEMVKVLENTFRMVNIGFANEVAMICRRLGVDVWEVIESAGTKPYGFMPFYPGPGVGGHCIPVDPSYLQWKMRNLEYRTRFIDLGDDVNRSMPDYVVERVTDLLNDVGRSVRGSRILLVGVAYKPNISDTRESPAVKVAERLVERGADARYADPHVPSVMLGHGGRLGRVELNRTELEASDLVVITTRHDSIDWDLVRNHATLVLDTRGVLGGSGPGHHVWHTL
ncbi:MAG: nucleotide sugar dehydrogenase [Solirubrobacteraceae bacterium]